MGGPRTRGFESPKEHIIFLLLNEIYDSFDVNRTYKKFVIVQTRWPRGQRRWHVSKHGVVAPQL